MVGLQLKVSWDEMANEVRHMHNYRNKLCAEKNGRHVGGHGGSITGNSQQVH